MEKLVKTIRMHANDLHDGALGSQVADSLSPLLHRASKSQDKSKLLSIASPVQGVQGGSDFIGGEVWIEDDGGLA